jgi:hypothetical protein
VDVQYGGGTVGIPYCRGVVPEYGNDVRMVSATRSARLQYIIKRNLGTG